MMKFANVPMKNIGPIKISGNVLQGEYKIPLATFESPLWPSVDRGARLSTYTDSGISITVVDDRMTRSVLFEAPDALTGLIVPIVKRVLPAIMLDISPLKFTLLIKITIIFYFLIEFVKSFVME